MSRRDLLLAKAEARLKVSRSLIIDGFYEDAINRLYYANILHSRGIARLLRSQVLQAQRAC